MRESTPGWESIGSTLWSPFRAYFFLKNVSFFLLVTSVALWITYESVLDIAAIARGVTREEPMIRGVLDVLAMILLFVIFYGLSGFMLRRFLRGRRKRRAAAQWLRGFQDGTMSAA